MGRLDRLQRKRHPMFEHNRLTQWVIGFSFVYLGAVLLVLGALFGRMVQKAGMPPLVWLDKCLPVLLLMDALSRITLQQPVSRKIKPFLLLPLGRRRLQAMLLLRTGLQYINILWLLPVVPYAIITVGTEAGAWAAVRLLSGLWLVFVLNGCFHQFCRMLFAEHALWILLPIVLYTAAIAAGLLPGDPPFGLAQALAAGAWWSFGLVLAMIALVMTLYIRMERRFMYSELAHRSDLKVKHAARYAFLSRWGETGEFIRLQIRMLTRNKMPKRQLFASFFIILYAISMICFVYKDDVVQNGYMVCFAFFLTAVVLTSKTIGYDGHYFDGLMCRSGALEHLFRAAYLVRTSMLVLPLAVMLVPVFMHQIPLLQVAATALFTAGAVMCFVMHASLSDTTTMPLNATVTRGNTSGRSWQQLAIVMGLLVLSYVFFLPARLLGDAWYCVLGVIGLAFIAGHRIWIRLLCRRFVKHRYDYMDKLRATR